MVKYIKIHLIKWILILIAVLAYGVMADSYIKFKSKRDAWEAFYASEITEQELFLRLIPN